MFLIPLCAEPGIIVWNVGKIQIPPMNQFELFKKHYKLQEV